MEHEQTEIGEREMGGPTQRSVGDGDPNRDWAYDKRPRPRDSGPSKNRLKALIVLLSGILVVVIGWMATFDLMTAGSAHWWLIGLMVATAYLTLAAGSYFGVLQYVVRMNRLIIMHHEYHLRQEVWGIPDGDGGWIELNMGMEYADSELYEETERILKWRAKGAS